MFHLLKTCVSLFKNTITNIVDWSISFVRNTAYMFVGTTVCNWFFSFLEKIGFSSMSNWYENKKNNKINTNHIVKKRKQSASASKISEISHKYENIAVLPFTNISNTSAVKNNSLTIDSKLVKSFECAKQKSEKQMFDALTTIGLTMQESHDLLQLSVIEKIDLESLQKNIDVQKLNKGCKIEMLVFNILFADIKSHIAKKVRQISVNRIVKYIENNAFYKKFSIPNINNFFVLTKNQQNSSKIGFLLLYSELNILKTLKEDAQQREDIELYNELYELTESKEKEIQEIEKKIKKIIYNQLSDDSQCKEKQLFKQVLALSKAKVEAINVTSIKDEDVQQMIANSDADILLTYRQDLLNQDKHEVDIVKTAVNTVNSFNNTVNSVKSLASSNGFKRTVGGVTAGLLAVGTGVLAAPTATVLGAAVGGGMLVKSVLDKKNNPDVFTVTVPKSKSEKALKIYIRENNKLEERVLKNESPILEILQNIDFMESNKVNLEGNNLNKIFNIFKIYFEKLNKKTKISDVKLSFIFHNIQKKSFDDINNLKNNKLFKGQKDFIESLLKRFNKKYFKIKKKKINDTVETIKSIVDSYKLVVENSLLLTELQASDDHSNKKIVEENNKKINNDFKKNFNKDIGNENIDHVKQIILEKIKNAKKGIQEIKHVEIPGLDSLKKNYKLFIIKHKKTLELQQQICDSRKNDTRWIVSFRRDLPAVHKMTAELNACITDRNKLSSEIKSICNQIHDEKIKEKFIDANGAVVTTLNNNVDKEIDSCNGRCNTRKGIHVANFKNLTVLLTNIEAYFANEKILTLLKNNSDKYLKNIEIAENNLFSSLKKIIEVDKDKDKREFISEFVKYMSDCSGSELSLIQKKIIDFCQEQQKLTKDGRKYLLNEDVQNNLFIKSKHVKFLERSELIKCTLDWLKKNITLSKNEKNILVQSIKEDITCNKLNDNFINKLCNTISDTLKTNGQILDVSILKESLSGMTSDNSIEEFLKNKKITLDRQIKESEELLSRKFDLRKFLVDIESKWEASAKDCYWALDQKFINNISKNKRLEYQKKYPNLFAENIKDQSLVATAAYVVLSVSKKAEYFLNESFNDSVEVQSFINSLMKFYKLPEISGAFNVNNDVKELKNITFLDKMNKLKEKISSCGECSCVRKDTYSTQELVNIITKMHLVIIYLQEAVKIENINEKTKNNIKQLLQQVDNTKLESVYLVMENIVKSETWLSLNLMPNDYKLWQKYLVGFLNETNSDRCLKLSKKVVSLIAHPQQNTLFLAERLWKNFVDNPNFKYLKLLNLSPQWKNKFGKIKDFFITSISQALTSYKNKSSVDILSEIEACVVHQKNISNGKVATSKIISGVLDACKLQMGEEIGKQLQNVVEGVLKDEKNITNTEKNPLFNNLILHYINVEKLLTDHILNLMAQKKYELETKSINYSLTESENKMLSKLTASRLISEFDITNSTIIEKFFGPDKIESAKKLLAKFNMISGGVNIFDIKDNAKKTVIPIPNYNIGKNIINKFKPVTHLFNAIGSFSVNINKFMELNSSVPLYIMDNFNPENYPNNFFNLFIEKVLQVGRNDDLTDEDKIFIILNKQKDLSYIYNNGEITEIKVTNKLKQILSPLNISEETNGMQSLDGGKNIENIEINQFIRAVVGSPSVVKDFASKVFKKAGFVKIPGDLPFEINLISFFHRMFQAVKSVFDIELPGRLQFYFNKYEYEGSYIRDAKTGRIMYFTNSSAPFNSMNDFINNCKNSLYTALVTAYIKHNDVPSDVDIGYLLNHHNAHWTSMNCKVSIDSKQVAVHGLLSQYISTLGLTKKDLNTPNVKSNMIEFLKETCEANFDPDGIIKNMNIFSNDSLNAPYDKFKDLSDEMLNKAKGINLFNMKLNEQVGMACGDESIRFLMLSALCRDPLKASVKLDSYALRNGGSKLSDKEAADIFAEDFKGIKYDNRGVKYDNKNNIENFQNFQYYQNIYKAIDSLKKDNQFVNLVNSPDIVGVQKTALNDFNSNVEVFLSSGKIGYLFDIVKHLQRPSVLPDVLCDYLQKNVVPKCEIFVNNYSMSKQYYDKFANTGVLKINKKVSNTAALNVGKKLSIKNS